MDNNKKNLNKKANDFSEGNIDDDFEALLQNENNSEFDYKQEKIKTKKVIGNKDKKLGLKLIKLFLARTEKRKKLISIENTINK